MPTLLIPDLMRFWSKVDRKSKDECWNWLGSKNELGYGRFRVEHKMYGSHRISYFIENDKDPKSSMVCHECNNPPCVNPYHLFLGDNSINMKQAYAEGRNSNKGILNSQSKLQEYDIKEIRNMQGIKSSCELAKIYDVSYKTIHKIWHRERWSHI